MRSTPAHSVDAVQRRVVLMAAFRHVVVAGSLVVASPWMARADTLETSESVIADSSDFETTPTVGADGVGTMVVYTLRPTSSSGFGFGSIRYQRLVDGAPSGAPVVVSA